MFPLSQAVYEKTHRTLLKILAAEDHYIDSTTLQKTRFFFLYLIYFSAAYLFMCLIDIVTYNLFKAFYKLLSPSAAISLCYLRFSVNHYD